MKMKLFKNDPRRGSALLAAMIVIVVLTFAAAGILSYSLNTYRNSVRQAMLDQGKEIADSEMDFMYYTWKGMLLHKDPVASIRSNFIGDGYLGTGLQPQAQVFQTSVNPWTVSRDIQFASINGTTDGGATGILPGTTSIGRNYYFTVMTSATVSAPLLGNVTYKSGRHFVYSSTSLFQYAVFYQGNLEIGAGGNMTINGPVSTNSSAFLGAQDNNGNPFTLTLTDSVAFFQDYNGAADATSGEVDYLLLGSANAIDDPIYNPNPQAAAPANQTAQRQIQVSKLLTQSSFIGGVDVQADVNNPAYALAYQDPQGVVDPNEVYRAVIAPSPTDDGTPLGNDLPEDQTVAGKRMYNNAGIVITVKQIHPGPAIAANLQIDVGISPDATTPRNVANLQMYNNVPQFATIVHPTGAATDVITGVRQNFVDPREVNGNGLNGVNLTTLDIGNLNVALNTGAMTGALQSNYNGVVYIYDATSPTINPSGTLNGIRLMNGTSTPAFNDQNGNPLGFSVVSDNGVYVQGDFNTGTTLIDGVQKTNPAAILGDAITALSETWNLGANATMQTLTGNTAGQREAQMSTNFPDTNYPAQVAINAAHPTIEPAVNAATVDGMQINAAILTGNTPTNVTASIGSGGAQNLVRMIEDWFYDPFGPPVDPLVPLGAKVPLTLTLNGSLGQLFTSKYFTGAYLGSGAGHGIYIQPKNRVMTYDLNFKNHTPAGSPSTTAFYRGDFFFW
jgi:hypothetical protein